HFLTLRDTDANISMQVTCHRSILLDDQLAEGARVILRVRPDFYAERGTLSLRATEIRQVGLGELLARIERLRQLLAAEGLFAGRASAAERDVVDNSRRRLPGARFRIESVATQGNTAVTEVIAALQRLDAAPDVQ